MSVGFFNPVGVFLLMLATPPTDLPSLDQPAIEIVLAPGEAAKPSVPVESLDPTPVADPSPREPPRLDRHTRNEFWIQIREAGRSETLDPRTRAELNTWLRLRNMGVVSLAVGGVMATAALGASVHVSDNAAVLFVAAGGVGLMLGVSLLHTARWRKQTTVMQRIAGTRTTVSVPVPTTIRGGAGLNWSGRF